MSASEPPHGHPVAGTESSRPSGGRGDVLLTGATGFLGRHVAAALVQGGYDVRATVRATSDLRPLEDLPVRTLRTNLGSRARLDEVVRGVDFVVHCAGVTRTARDAEFFEVNVEASERLASAAAAAGVRRFVFISSLAARGPDGAPGPTSAYGVSKREAESRLGRVAEERGLELRVLRPGGIYGPGDRDMVPLFRLARRGFLVLPRARGRLQPVYVTDVAAAVCAATERAGVGPEPLALAGEQVQGWNEVAVELGNAVGRRVRPVRVPAGVYSAAGVVAEAAGKLLRREPVFDRRRAADLARHAWTCDLEPARTALDWAPAICLPEGLALTAEWYRKQGWLRA